MPRGGNGAMPEEYGNIFLLAVSNARDGKNLVCQRHNAVSGRVAASDTPEILAAVERVRREKSTEDEMQFEGRGVPSGLKVYVACDSSFTYSVVVDRAYPDRHGYQMLREFARQMAGDYGGVLRGTKKAGGATGKVERVTTSLLEKYDDLANVDKVAALQSEVDKVKSRMNDNIQAQFANMESADDLEESTALMRDTGEKRRRQETPASPRLASPCSAGPCPAKRAGVVAAAHVPGWFKSADAVLLLTLLRARVLLAHSVGFQTGLQQVAQEDVVEERQAQRVHTPNCLGYAYGSSSSSRIVLPSASRSPGGGGGRSGLHATLLS